MKPNKQEKETFLLVSLQEGKAKRLAQVISNDTCRRILDYLAEVEDATESNIAAELDIPLSTVHYNLQHLHSGGLVEVEEFHYSKKGKEVNHYKLANKYIIIAPKSVSGFADKIKNILPVGILLGAAAAAYSIISRYIFKPEIATTLKEAAPDRMMGETIQAVVQETTTSIWQSIPLWFFIGVVSALVLYLVIEKIRK